MSENKEIILTNEGKAKLEEELSHLISVTRKEVSEKSKKPVPSATYPRTQSMMRQRMSRQR